MGGQRETRILAKRVNGLDETFSETCLADNQRAIVILEGAGNDFRGARALRIDQHDYRERIIGVRLLRSVGTVRTSGPSASLDDQLSFLEEGFANFNCLLKQPAWVIAEVEYETVELLRIAFLELVAKFP